MTNPVEGSDFYIHPQPLARLLIHERRHRHRVVGIQFITRDCQVRFGVAVGFTPFLFGAAVKSVAVVACAALLRRLPAFRS